MAETYSDYVHIRHPDYRMVIATDAMMPDGLQRDDWRLLKVRPADRLSAGGRKIVDDEGYAIIRVHVSLNELRAL
ncbi:hypothetical protein [Rhizobium sp. BK060]|uniref:hypothetical protein n=1 Tax=Rhizobium sp. BK060 TaxID=2587096 RepID=UPI0016107220|nr:hypothetical protein [Rhizobium sp. BK060]MBB3396161.1 hypothetical protein [Rhizobium sp. BK060]